MTRAQPAGLPAVTVVIPVRGDALHLGSCLESVRRQTYGGRLEIIVLDGGDDAEVHAVVAKHPPAQILLNPARRQAPGLNAGIAAASGQVVVRVDARTRLDPGYVSAAVEALSRTGAAMVGGTLEVAARGSTRQRGIGSALASPFGAAVATYRRAGGEGWTDVVYLGAFHRATALAAGGFDEAAGANEDAEFAYRMSTRGGIWLEPTMRSIYIPRDDLPSVMRQFFAYGRGRARTIRLHPSTLRWRQFAAPLLLLGLLSPWRRRVSAAYLAGIVITGMPLARRDPKAALWRAAALPAMHLPWAAGFAVGWLDALHERR
jgi:succinoglycan biosynthesis protein ExoA